MALHFHPLSVHKIIRETTDSVSVCFQVPDDLKNTFKYREGQNITIRAAINGEEVRRSYSICTAPHENLLKIGIKQVDGGVFSTFANTILQETDTLDVMPPSGHFNAKLKDGVVGNYLAIAAGSGITPILSIIKHTLHTQSKARFTLIYGNRERSSIMFFEELESIKNKYPQRFNLIHVLSREVMEADILSGRINPEKLKAFQKLVDYTHQDSIYLCGPEKMIFDASDFLQNLGIDKKKIHFELFTSTTPKAQSSQAASTAIEDNRPKSKVSIQLDGRTTSFELGFSGKSILDAALQQGADLPFACKGGVCCTCRAKLLEGQVSMDVNYSLEPEEIEKGFILTCQAHPLTEKVVIDFDVR